MKFVKIQILLFFKAFIDLLHRIKHGKKEVEQQPVRSIQLKRGLTLYQLELSECGVSRVKVAVIDDDSEYEHIVMRDSKHRVTSETFGYEYRNDCLYAQALNDKTAVKKFKKEFKDMYLGAVQRGDIPADVADMNRTITMIHFAK